MKLAGLLFIALATTGCVTQTVRTRTVPDLYHLCGDDEYRSMCTPAASEQPIRVDTNLLAPQPATHVG